MFERYTDRARRVIFFARYDASALASSSIDTEHLLLGLLREGTGITGRIFKRNNLTYEVVRREIEARGRLQAPTSTSVDMPLSPEAMLVLRHGSEEAERMDAAHVDTEHLLLGLLRESECLAADILTSKGLHLEEVREETRLQRRRKETAAPPKEAFPKLVDFLRRLEDRRAAYHEGAAWGVARLASARGRLSGAAVAGDSLSSHERTYRVRGEITASRRAASPGCCRSSSSGSGS